MNLIGKLNKAKEKYCKQTDLEFIEEKFEKISSKFCPDNEAKKSNRTIEKFLAERKKEKRQGLAEVVVPTTLCNILFWICFIC
jgi:hypothetical protein